MPQDTMNKPQRAGKPGEASVMVNSNEDMFALGGGGAMDNFVNASIISKPGQAQADLSGFQDMIMCSPDRNQKVNRMISRQQSMNKQPSFGQSGPMARGPYQRQGSQVAD